jgi:anthranilate phosphoribosyltransferase
MTAEDALRRIMGGATLPHEHAAALMDEVMRGTVDDATFGATFAALHVRGETVEELAGFAESMRRHVVVAPAPPDAVDTCGTGGDGADTFNVSTCAAFVVAGTGATVAKHGNRAVSSSCGSADVLEALGGRLEATPEQVARTLDRARFAFLFAPAFHPSMRHAARPRRAMGIRTAFNFLGPITNPAGVRRQVVGVSDAAMAERVARVLQRLGVERAIVVHGTHDGLDELTIAGTSTVHDVTQGAIRTYQVEPEQVGLARAPLAAIRGGDAARNAAILRAVLDGSERGAPRDVVLLNAAAGILAAGRAQDLAEGVALGAAAIDDGAASDQLDRWIVASSDAEAAA